MMTMAMVALLSLEHLDRNPFLLWLLPGRSATWQKK
jgi:hypothetical protein